MMVRSTPDEKNGRGGGGKIVEREGRLRRGEKKKTTSETLFYKIFSTNEREVLIKILWDHTARGRK